MISILVGMFETAPKNMKKRLQELEIIKIETIREIALSSVRIPRKVLENKGDLLANRH